jgi:hypothetical protein
MRGVPLRIEVGPRDVEKRQVVLARRDMPGKTGKSFVPEDGLHGAVTAMLESIQKAMFERAQAFMRENTAEPRTYDEFKQAIEAGLFCRVWWSGDAEREAAIKDETKATIRCIPLEQPGEQGVCIGTGRPATRMAIFGRAYETIWKDRPDLLHSRGLFRVGTEPHAKGGRSWTRILLTWRSMTASGRLSPGSCGPATRNPSFARSRTTRDRSAACSSG